MKLSCLLVSLALLAGCSANGTIHADAIDTTLTIVCDRDDVYIDSDPTLSPADKATKHRDNTLLRKVVAAAKLAENGPQPVTSPAGSK